FVRLGNGHYMALGSNRIAWNPDGMAPAQATGCDSMILPILIEYDKKGKVVWSWKLSDHYKVSHLPYEIQDGIRRIPDPHANGFYFDEKKQVVYVSLKE